MNFTDYVHYAKNNYSWLGEELLHRYLHTYGTCMEHFLAHRSSLESLGTRFGPSLYQAEVDYLLSEEWAEDADDILTRRTKLILEMDSAHQAALKEYIKTQTTAQPECTPV